MPSPSLNLPGEPGPSRMVSPEELCPLPKAERQVTRDRSRARRIPVVLTSTPEKKLERFITAARGRNGSSLNKVSLDVNPDEDHGQTEKERVGPEQDPRLEDFSPAHIKAGDFFLVAVRGGRRNTQTFRYVA